MCTNYRPPTRDIVAQMFNIAVPTFDYPQETYPTDLAPAVWRSTLGQFEAVPAAFGLTPYWARDQAIARRTYNARSETVAQKPAFRGAWGRGQRALIPMQRFYEPSWCTGRAVRWRIERSDGRPFAVAAVWDRWRDRAAGGAVDSFSLLTIAAAGHPVMGQFHRPGDEKRSVVPIAAEHWSAWLDDDPEAALRLLRPLAPHQYCAAADPLPPAPRSTRSASPSQSRAGSSAAGIVTRVTALATRPQQLWLPGLDSDNSTSDE